MAKREKLGAQLQRLHAISADVKVAGVRPAAVRSDDEWVNTGVNLRRQTINLLRRAAVAQAAKYGGRSSVSAAIERLVDRHRGELEAEIRESGE